MAAQLNTDQITIQPEILSAQQQQRHLVHENPPHCQQYDRVVITTVPRFKQSEVTGDEWRLAAEAQFFYKDVPVGTVRLSRVSDFIADNRHIPEIFPPRHVAGTFEHMCDQESCTERWVNRFALKRLHCEHGCELGNWGTTSVHYRQFCAAHSNRGDCGINDARSNYELIEGPGLAWRPERGDKVAFIGNPTAQAQ